MVYFLWPLPVLQLFHTAPRYLRLHSYAPGTTDHPLYLRGGAVSLPFLRRIKSNGCGACDADGGV